jgi:hypothetical protein
MKWLVILALCAGCKKQPEAPPPRPDRPTLPASEVKRAHEACQTYVDKVCACAKTVAAMTEPCALARALPEAIQVALDVAATPDSTRRDVLQAHDSVRNVAKECIEKTAALPAAGCP